MKNKIIYIILGILLIAGIVVIILNGKKEFKRFEFKKHNIVMNHTDFKYADTITLYVLENQLHLDSVKLDIHYIVRKDMNVDAFILKNAFTPHNYIIYIRKDVSPFKINEIISHELIHLDQSEKGDLIDNANGKYVVYKNDTIYFKDVIYDKRLYEKDAFDRSYELLIDLNKNIYK